MARQTGIPPLFLLVLVAAAMALADRLLGQFELAWRLRMPLAVVTGACGLVVGALALLPFRRARTTVDPRRPERASTLVTGGIYAVSRNPMYLAMLLALIAWGLWLGNALALVVAPPAFVLYLNRRQIGPEERALESAFGEEYVRYRRAVRRWL